MARLEQTLLKYENDFFDYKFCNNASNLENRIAEGFIECGISGIYTKHDIIKSLSKITESRRIKVSGFHAELLSDTVALARYKAFFEDTERISSHSSVWIKNNDDWKIFYHQATIHIPLL